MNRTLAAPALVVLTALAVLAVLAGTALGSPDDHVWREGESLDHGKTYPHSWYSGAVESGHLSGGAFASSFTAEADTEIGYDVKIPAKGSWTLWARVNPVQAVLEWRAGKGDWQRADLSGAVDRVNIATDGKPDLRFLAWVRLGEVELAKGTTRVDFAFRSRNRHHGALDCFLLTQTEFRPSGKRRPGEPLTDADPGFFAFDPGPDRLADDALLDLRHLNEDRAGESGPLRRDGDRIVRGDGTPIRLWGANAGPADSRRADVHLAERLAKYGFNAARLHGLIAKRSGSDPLAVDPGRLERLHSAVAAFADEGVYSVVSTYFPLWLRLRAEDGIEGARLGEHPFALLHFDPRMQELWKAWASGVLTAENPHTGMPLARDPAVAAFEIVNEDSLLFWTFTEKNVGAGPWRRIESLFTAHAVGVHGSVRKALAAWDGARHPHDAGAHLGLFGPWQMTRDGLAQASAGQRLRVREQARFLAETQRAVYADLAAHVRGLGFEGMIVASNWQTADGPALLGLERWSYTAVDLIDRHGYVGGAHGGEASNYSVRVGHTFADRSALRDPGRLPIAVTQVAGLPHIHSEIAWSQPNRLNAEGPLVLGAYGALQGLDGWFLFATRGGAWSTEPTAKWPLMRPSHLGQSPAAALLFRRGDVAAARVVSRRVTGVDGLLPPDGGFTEGASADFRAANAAPGLDDPLAAFAGRVEVAIEGVGSDTVGSGGAGGEKAGGDRAGGDRAGGDRAGGGKRPQAVALPAGLVDRESKRVESVTGEVALDWGAGVVTVDTPRSQAVAGYLADAGTVALGDISIRCGNEYAAIHVIALDDEPIASSRRLLVQAFSREQLYGFRSADGRIESLGRAPWNVETIDAEISLPAGRWKATSLDGNGYARGVVKVSRRTLRLPPDGLYTVLTR